MGERALAFLDALDFPLSRKVEDTPGEIRAHGDDRGTGDAQRRRVARRGAREDSILERLSRARPLVGRVAPVLASALMRL